MTIKIPIDIETIPDQSDNALARAAERVKVPANYKKPETIEKYIEEHTEEEHAKTGLNGLYGEICCIGFVVDDGHVHMIMRDQDRSEAWLLETFWKRLENRVGDLEYRAMDVIQYPQLEWIGHNVIDFDLRFLYHRSLINGIRPPSPLPVDARHGQGKVFDTMREWAGFRGYVSLDALAQAFGLEGKGDISGKDVWPLWQAGEYDTICDYCKHDVELTWEVYKRLTWQA